MQTPLDLAYQSRCNWCGKEIEDPAYQAQAETERAAFFAQQAIHDAESLMRTEAMLSPGFNPLSLNQVLGLPQFPGRRGGVMGRTARRQMAAREIAVAEAQLGAVNGAPPPPSFGTALTSTSSTQSPSNDQAAVDAAYEAAQESQRAAAQRYVEPQRTTETEPRPWYAAPAARNSNALPDTPGISEQTAGQQSGDELPGPPETTSEHTHNRFQTLEW